MLDEQDPPPSNAPLRKEPMGEEGGLDEKALLPLDAVLETLNGEAAGSGKSVFPLSLGRKGSLITFRNGP